MVSHLPTDPNAGSPGTKNGVLINVKYYDLRPESGLSGCALAVEQPIKAEEQSNNPPA